METNLIVSGKKAIQRLSEDPKLKKLIKVVYLNKTQNFLIEICQKNNVKYEIKDKIFFDKRFGNKTKYKYKYANAVIEAKPPISLQEIINKNKEKGLLVVLDHIQDPFNVGAILRTCVAAGVNAVIIPKDHVAPINHEAVIKASQGYSLNIDIAFVANMQQAIIKLKRSGYWIYATVLDENSKNFKDIKYEKKSVLILGSEGDGVSYILKKTSDHHIYIPMSNEVDSLNVSVAAGIILFEMVSN